MKNIPKIYKYGIEITKPWSREMYGFNEKIKSQYTQLIVDLINELETPEECIKLAVIVNPYGYGSGLNHDVEYMKDDMKNNVINSETYWIKEIVEELLKINLIKPILQDDLILNIIGFESRDEILNLREIFSK